jgi:hypothetical protein
VKRFWDEGWMGEDLTYLTSVDAILGQNLGDGVPFGVQWLCYGDRSGKVANVEAVEMRSEYNR